MKKLVSYLLVAIMMLCFVGCGAPKATEKTPGNQVEEKLDAYGILKEATENMNRLESMDMTMDMDMNMAMGEEVMVYKMSSDIQLQDNNKETMKFKMPMTITATVSGEQQTMESTSYYADGYLYTEAMGQKVKQAMDLDDAKDMLGDTTEITDMDMDTLTNLKIEAKNDGYEIAFEVEEDVINDMADDLLSAFLGSEVSDSETINMKVGSMGGTYTITKDKMITKVSIQMNMEITEGEETLKADYVIEITYNNPGETVTVELPDFSDYVENAY